eukprot:PITA_24599
MAETGFGKMTDEASYLKWNPFDGPISSDRHYEISFMWNSDLGVSGAFLVRNMHSRQFFLKSLTLDIPGQGKLLFKCNSWITPYGTSKIDRIFFSNKSYLPEETPEGLKKLREQDMVELRGNGTGERKVYDQIYDYDVYKDLGNPDSSPELLRPALGGSKGYPYARRCRTGRPPTKTEVTFISPDERFPHTDFTDFGAHTTNAFANLIVPEITEGSKNAFKTFEQIEQLYVRGFQSRYNSLEKLHRHENPLQIVHGLLESVEDNPLIEFA